MDILLDTNVLVRRLHVSDVRYAAARAALDELSTNGHRFCVTSQNLIELWAVCTRPSTANGLGLSTTEADLILRHVRQLAAYLADSDAIFPEWLRLVNTYGISGKQAHDARLVAAMNVHGVKHTLTFNGRDFLRYPALTILDPHAVAGPSATA